MLYVNSLKIRPKSSGTQMLQKLDFYCISSMEPDIIVEGFKESIKMHNIILCK